MLLFLQLNIFFFFVSVWTIIFIESIPKLVPVCDVRSLFIVQIEFAAVSLLGDFKWTVPIWRETMDSL